MKKYFEGFKKNFKKRILRLAIMTAISTVVVCLINKFEERFASPETSLAAA